MTPPFRSNADTPDEVIEIRQTPSAEHESLPAGASQETYRCEGSGNPRRNEIRSRTVISDPSPSDRLNSANEPVQLVLLR